MSTEVIKAETSALLEDRVRQVGEFASWQIRHLDDTVEGDHERGKWQLVLEILSGASTFPRAGYKVSENGVDMERIHEDES